MDEQNISPEEQELMEMEKQLSEGDQPEEAENTEKDSEEKSEEDKKEESTDESEEETEEEDESDDDSEKEEEEEATRQPHVPYKKFKAEREKRKELEATLSEMQADIEAIKNSSKSEAQKKDEISELAEEYGVDPDFTKKLSEKIKSSIKSPISEEELAEWRSERELKNQEQAFNTEFDELLDVRPDAKEHKAKLKKLAFDKKYAGKNFKSLLYIYAKEIEPNLGNKKTAEKTVNKRADGTVLDYKEMTEEEATKLPPEQFLEWVEYQSKQ